MEESERDKISNGDDSGEGLISRLMRDRATRNAGTVKVFGDNAAVIDHCGDLTVASACMLTEGIHFSLVYNPLRHLGYKSAVKGFSKIYAMNAVPEQLIVSLAFSAKILPGMIEEFYEGLDLACDNYGVDLVGGEVTSSLTGMTISCTALGKCRNKEIIYRKGAEVNDLICVTGDLGAAYMGLQVLERERMLFEKHDTAQPVLEGYDYIIGRQLKPEARKDITVILRDIGVTPTSMTDISDSLSGEIRQLCMESDKGCRIYPERIPLHPSTVAVAEEFNIEPVIAAIYGGEDYELLFTVKQGDYKKIADYGEIKIIGHIVDKPRGIYMVTDSGEIEIKSAGWNSML